MGECRNIVVVTLGTTYIHPLFSPSTADAVLFSGLVFDNDPIYRDFFWRLDWIIIILCFKLCEGFGELSTVNH